MSAASGLAMHLPKRTKCKRKKRTLRAYCIILCKPRKVHRPVRLIASQNVASLLPKDIIALLLTNKYSFEVGCLFSDLYQLPLLLETHVSSYLTNFNSVSPEAPKVKTTDIYTDL